jgi:hypothetical protein
MEKLKQIKISNKSFGQLNGATIYLEAGLHDQLVRTKTKNGHNLITLLGQGRALRGFKHLLEFLTAKDKSLKIILSQQETAKTQEAWVINYEEYKSKTSGKFFALYRSVGLDSAKSYLNQYFPSDFEYKKSGDKAHKISRGNVSQVLDQMEEKQQTKKEMLKRTSKIVSDLHKQKTSLKKEIAEIEVLKKSSNLAIMKNSMNELNDRLDSDKKYKETSGKNSWQSWVFKNSWMFGISFLKPIEKQKIGFDNIPDFIFPTVDGFLDILEIKLPEHEVIKSDSSHSGSFIWSPKAGEAIGQVVTYLHEIELNQLQLKEKIKEKYNLDLMTIKPRAYILIGDHSDWDEPKIKALRKLNYSLHGIEILTYADLKLRAEQLMKLLEIK